MIEDLKSYNGLKIKSFSIFKDFLLFMIWNTGFIQNDIRNNKDLIKI